MRVSADVNTERTGANHSQRCAHQNTPRHVTISRQQRVCRGFKLCKCYAHHTIVNVPLPWSHLASIEAAERVANAESKDYSAFVGVQGGL